VTPYPSPARACKGRNKTTVARLRTDQSTAWRIGDLFAERFDPVHTAAAVVEAAGGGWIVELCFASAPDRDAVRKIVALAAGPQAARALTFETVAEKDWVAASLEGLQPVAAGRFVVHGRHDRARVAVNRVGIEIEAALAFGTGHHGTTRGCLLALDSLCKSHPRRRILDLGTGSGVLAIAAARALRQPVLATDIDGAAVRAARANAALNRAGSFVEVIKADGVTGPKLRERAPYDLVLANILLRPLQRLAAPLTRLTAPGARVVLSGLLVSQANAAIAAYRGLALERRIDLDGWTTLVLVRRTRRPGASVAGRRVG
jgi:ribosomal protein L11 methyltransferase